MNENYGKLAKIFSKVIYLQDASRILDWDSNVLMPIDAAPYRANQTAAIVDSINGLIQNPDNLELIKRAKDEKLSAIEKANLAEIEYMVQATLAVDRDLLAEFERARLATEVTWRKAKSANNFNIVAKELDALFKLNLEIAGAKASGLNISIYQSMINDYDRGLDEAELEKLFDDIITHIPELVKKVKKDESLECNFPVKKEDQKFIAEKLTKIFGYKGRIDESLHPFCGGNSYDLRITTFYPENNFMQTLLAVIHETGHALYEQNKPLELADQPVGRARGMVIHESQSLFMEKQIGSSKYFLQWLCTFISKNLPQYKFSPEQLFSQINNVTPSFIRVFADEVTYPLHVAVRYMIEKKLVAGQVSIQDLPEIWDDIYEKYLGIRPRTQSEGCLQDIHWYMGAFGYFPSYTAGAVISAMIAKKMRSEIAIDSDIQNGKFENITGWLKNNIHSKASTIPMKEMLNNLFGTGLDFGCYHDY